MILEEKYKDVLQNIETIIVAAYRNNNEMNDYSVLRTLEALFGYYQAEKRGKEGRKFSLDEEEDEIYGLLIDVCDWRLGKRILGDKEESQVKPITLDELILCINRIIKSVKRWNKHGGRKGYLDYVSQFM